MVMVIVRSGGDRGVGFFQTKKEGFFSSHDEYCGGSEF